jgi:hypothetical protein
MFKLIECICAEALCMLQVVKVQYVLKGSHLNSGAASTTFDLPSAVCFAACLSLLMPMPKLWCAGCKERKDPAEGAGDGTGERCAEALGLGCRG